MVRQIVHVTCPQGIHLRPAGMLSAEALKYQSEIYILKKNHKANIKSVLSLLAACVKSEEDIEIVCDGPDEEEAMKMVVHFIQNME